MNIEQHGLEQEKCYVYSDGISVNFRQNNGKKTEAIKNSTKSVHEGGEAWL